MRDIFPILVSTVRAIYIDMCDFFLGHSSLLQGHSFAFSKLLCPFCKTPVKQTVFKVVYKAACIEVDSAKKNKANIKCNQARHRTIRPYVSGIHNKILLSFDTTAAWLFVGTRWPSGRTRDSSTRQPGFNSCCFPS